MKKTIRWGILGPGKIARKFAHDLQLSSTSRLQAIGSRSIDRAIEFANDFPAEKIYGSYEALLEDSDVDIIYIATPHSHHYSWILRCLDNGKSVLCEKPMCINADQVRQVIKKQNETGLFVMEALWTRFLPAYQHMRELLRSEGHRIQSVTADFCYLSERGQVERVYNPSLAGGSLLDIGIYPLFLALDLMGSPQHLNASGWVEEGIDVRMSAVLEYEEGRSAMIFSDVQSSTRMDAIIRMKDQVIILPHQWHSMNEYSVMKDNCFTVYKHPRIGWGYFHEIEHVNQCLIRNLNESPEFTLSDSLNLAKYMDAIREKIDLRYPSSIEKV